MALALPYTYFQCPCTDNSVSTRRVGDESPTKGGEDEDERTFDPRAPRSSYSLYPLEHLLYCEDCDQIRCPRCVLDEIVTWYCPNCLFEVPSSTVKSEGNRCTRSCFQCPCCTSPLSVNSLETPAPAAMLGAEQAVHQGPWVLGCSYCNWSSKEIGIQFEKPNGIYAQLAKIKNGGDPYIPPRERKTQSAEQRITSTPLSITTTDTTSEPNTPKPEFQDEELDAETHFHNLRSFYTSQQADTVPASSLSFSGDYGYGSPTALSRIMGLYTGGSFSDKKAKSKTTPMREADSPAEGLKLLSESDDEDAPNKLSSATWDGTTSRTQRLSSQPLLASQMRPQAHLLRTKRSKRCRACRHILSKPESKVSNTRFRIRLIASNYIPTLIIKQLAPPVATSLGTLVTPLPSQMAKLTFVSGRTTQFVLTLKNPLFEPIKVTLATPAYTPGGEYGDGGKGGSKVTVLCPQFEVGANTDVWDEALSKNPNSPTEQRRVRSGTVEGQLMGEAGKIWEKGRNWVSVVVEVVPKQIETEFKEDEDILEIPLFVRVEWEGQEEGEEGREKKELAYWCVLGCGRIVPF